MIFLHIFARIIAIVLDAVSLAMFIRAILPFFVNVEDSRIYMFLVFITEPFLIPVRFFLSKFKAIQNSPIDWSFTVCYLIIAFIRLVLPTV